MSEEDTSDALDLQRLGLLTLAAMAMSTNRSIQLSQSRQGVYRVDVVAHDLHHTSRSSISMLDAMDNACDWLRRMAKPLGPASKILRFRRPGVGSVLLGLLLVCSAHAAEFTCVPPLGSAQPGQTYQCTATFDSRTLTDGLHTITVRAYNAAGEMVEDQVQVTVDNTPPVIVITRPTPQATYKDPGVTPAGSAIDVTTAVQTVTAMLDGIAQPVTRNGAFWSMAPITKKGSHTLIITARDGAGNLTSRTVTFKITGGK